MGVCRGTWCEDANCTGRREALASLSDAKALTLVIDDSDGEVRTISENSIEAGVSHLTDGRWYTQVSSLQYYHSIFQFLCIICFLYCES